MVKLARGGYLKVGNNNEKLQKRLLEEIEKLGQQIEKFNIAEYLELINNPKRYFWVNFLGGVLEVLGLLLE